MVKVLECIMDRVNKPQDMAKKNGQDNCPYDINNLKKKFQRRLDEFQKLYFKPPSGNYKRGSMIWKK